MGRQWCTKDVEEMEASGKHKCNCHDIPFCRICYDSNDESNDMEMESRGRLIAPCLCDGSMKYVHQCCIQRWIKISRSRKCELCNFRYAIRRHVKENKGWKFYAFEIIILLLAAWLSWHSAVAFTSTSSGLLQASFFAGLMGLILAWCKFRKGSDRSEYVYVVQEPSNRRMRKLRRNTMT
ncbi:E3 ubiquitin-protein ligase 8-Mar [Echinococcus granulosus]|uniref:E3 ubiquitin-protein ligase 8-Mar n=1 Tax=Echinococcus granulosus TaxID=6210 RepID=W6UXJ0_ECHGR|nr:E3 ubiquitin-protein ligase 8-Mar [Echinococcus granulosus]EUB58274.1 E3 ubiquitin-protein ligase 8-Mar [Echinococcus granulosus]